MRRRRAGRRIRRRSAQRGGSLRRSLDVGDAVGVERHRRGQHDEEGDDVRERHSHDRVDLDAAQIAVRLSRGALQRAPAAVRPHLLDLLRRLPEEQIRADRGAEHRDDGGDVFLLPRDVRKHGVSENRRPGHMHHEDRADVGQQRKRQPLENVEYFL